jgi:acyl-CoA oxidase
MLMKYTKVNRDGSVVEPPMAQLAYGALVGGRTTMIQESADFAKKALTIAIRYGVVRRQFGGKSGKLENKIMDYGTHKMRLIPALAITYAMHFAAVEVTSIYDSLMEQLSQMKKPNSASSAKMAELIDTLKETHGTSAGLKAFCSWKALEIIETCRQACGGQGYSSYAGLASMYQDFAVQCTWEGDNTVMTLQLGRYLVSSLKERLLKKKQLPSGIAYLNGLPEVLKQKCPSNSNVSDPKVISEAMDVTCANAVMMAAEEFNKFKSQGLSEDEAYEKSSVQRFVAAKLHCYNYIYRKFLSACDRSPVGIKTILSQLCSLYGLHSISENAGWFLQFGYLNPGHMQSIQTKILDLLDQIRPQVIPLTDSFGLTDYVINSPLGCADGDVYRRIFEKTVQRNPPKPHAYFEKVIKPVLHRKEQSPEVIEM